MAHFTVDAIYPDKHPRFARHPSRRSVVHSTRGMVACSQPLAAEAGQRILKMGGNAADAAVAVAAALGVTEPGSTGVGGDMFCLFFDAKTRQIHALNGSGRSPSNTTLAQVRDQLGLSGSETGRIPPNSGLSVTVPGAPAGWLDTIERFGSGKLTLGNIFAPAIELCEEGFPVSEVSAAMWQDGEQLLKQGSPNFRDMLKLDKESDQQARAPRAGEIIRNPLLADVLKSLSSQGKKAFYTGRVAQAIVDSITQKGGRMELKDLEDHMNSLPHETNPISLKFQGQDIKNKSTQRLATSNTNSYSVELWEFPPNGQGIIALMALGILEELELSHQIPKFGPEEHNSAPYLHAVIEALHIAFADAKWWVTDPDRSPVTPAQMISREYLAERASLFNRERAGNHMNGQPGRSPAQNRGDTVYFSVIDKDGNGMSFVNSIASEFGSGIVPENCGFVLQCRGFNFDLGPDHHPNIYAGGKRSYHTIIPGLTTHGEGEDRQLHSILGVMGGMMQPQGHVQVLLNMEVFDMNPQQALDAPRVLVSGMGARPDSPMGIVYVEGGIDDDVFAALKGLGHDVQRLTEWRRGLFGRGQVIRRHVDAETGQTVFSGGSDMRGDGCAMPV